MKLHKDLFAHNTEIWGCRVNTSGKKGLKSEMKMPCCLRLLRTGRAYDHMDDSPRMGEETILLYFRHFCRDVKAIYDNKLFNHRLNAKEEMYMEQNYSEAGLPGSG